MKRIALFFEWLCLFWLYPLVGFFDIFAASKFLIFAAPVLYALIVFLAAKGYRQSNTKAWYSRKALLTRALLVSLAICLFALFQHPESFLYLPQHRTSLWLMIMCLYPLMSALPQEFLYRKFYFWRYRSIMPHGWPDILLNAAAFSFLHIIYDNITSIVLTFVGGILFATIYLRTNRLIYPWVEHAIYGLSVFTYGLGHLFYEPIPN